MDSNQRFLAQVISKSWHFTVLVEAHDTLGHQGVNRTYHLVRHQYYWKGMNKDVHKYINNCALWKRGKAKTQMYPLQMTDICDRPFDKIGIDLVLDFSVSPSRNQHILTIIDHLMGWPEAFPFPKRRQIPLSASSSRTTCQSTCALTSYFQLMAQNSKTSWWTMFSNNLALTLSFVPNIPHNLIRN